MTSPDKQKPDPGNSGKKDPVRPHSGHDDACRCKETAQMTPKQLLGRMLNDLAFWKKSGQDK
ncbi:MAG: hypothetical protein OEW15_13045 [Nitrospirota bacterium]|nr:hypothetical protein [Nitrospirota bacterium]